MVELTDIQQRIRTLLITAISEGNPQTVQNIFNNNENEYDDIQAVLCYTEPLIDIEGTILNGAITHLSNEAKEHREIGESVEIIKLIWQKADQKTRDSVCDRTVDKFQSYSEEINDHIGICPDLKEVIQEMEEHKRVKDLDCNLQEAITSLDVERVEKALEDCGEDIEKVLIRDVYWNDFPDIDCLLIFPLIVNNDIELSQEDMGKIKEITQLLWNEASSDVRDFWLASRLVNGEDKNTGDNYIIHSLETQQRDYANKAGKVWLKDLIQGVRDYKKNREMELSEPLLKEIEEKERIAQDDRKLAERLQFEQEGDNASISSDSTDATAIPENNGTSLPDDEQENTVDAATTSVNGSEASPAPATGNTTPEKNDTNFWSEHKGKIALGSVTGLCVAGAIAAYVLAYSAVALALAGMFKKVCQTEK